MTKIEWTRNADGTQGETWNPIVGCSLESPGCTNCYAMPMAKRLEAMGIPAYEGLTQDSKAGPVWTGKLAFSESALVKPLSWKKPRTVFVNSMGDLFHEDCPDEWIDRVFAVMALCPQHTFQVLTKRARRMREYLGGFTCDGARRFHIAEQIAHLEICADVPRNTIRRARETSISQRTGVQVSKSDWPLPNVWLGVSVEDQRRADERISDLLATPAAIRWISAEPLLGPVDLRWIAQPDDERDGVIDALLGCDWIQIDGSDFEPVRPGHQGRKMGRWVVSSEADILANRKLDWVVVGGESGKDARPMHPDWARSLRDQCSAAGVPFFFKQWGEWRPYCEADDFTNNDPTGEYGNPGARARHVPALTGDPPVPGNIMIPVGKKRAGRLLDGIEHNGMPEIDRLLGRVM